MRNPPSARFYYPGLDGLRFLAFLLVFIHNAPATLPYPFFETVHEYGWIGVDLFLCLSAFLLTRLLIHEHDRNGTIQIRNFYIRRILRIWPLYLLFVLISTVITIRLSGWTPITSLRFAGLVTFTDNIMAVWLGFNTFAFAPHLWTISYEEQFYAVLPWALSWLLKRTEHERWIAITAVIAAFMWTRAAFIYQNAPYPAIYVLPVTHFMSIMGGFALGLGLWNRFFEKAPRWSLGLGGAAYLGVILMLPNKEIPGWHQLVTYPGISLTILLYVVLRGKSGLFEKVFGNRVLSHLGKISFGLYMFHFFGLNVGVYLAQALHLGKEQPVTYPLFILVAGLLVTWSYAEISYRFLETPFLRLKQKFTEVPSRPL